MHKPASGSRGFAVALSCSLLLSAICAVARADSSLYQRMGGQAVVSAVVNETIDRVVADPRLGRSFKDSNIRRIKEKLAEQICQLAGGGCEYTGDPMRETHAGHAITQADFFGLVEVLRSALKHHHVALRERNELLAKLAPMQRDVVNVPVPKPAPPAVDAQGRP